MKLKLVNKSDYGEEYLLYCEPRPENISVVYSPDDNGWYAQRWKNDYVSKVYKDKAVLLKDLKSEKVDWQE